MMECPRNLGSENYFTIKKSKMRKKIHNALMTVILLIMPYAIFGQTPDLGSASGFAMFTAVGAFNNVGASTVTGDVGTDVGAFAGFPPGTLIGTIHVADGISATAAADVDAAYTFLSGLTCGTVIGTTMGSGQILTPDTYCLGAASTINGDLILDALGDPNALFIFKIDGALATGTFANIILVNSASLCNVYWQVNGQFDLGENSVFNGTLINNGAINLLDGSSLFGRGLSRAGAISMNNNTVTTTLPSVFYADADGDGFGDISSTITNCYAPAGYVSNSSDCNDLNAAINPLATEICNGIDDNCTGGIDDGIIFTDYYTDADGDGFGDASASPVSACAPVVGSVANNNDCDDLNAAINPLATEICNGIDDNCTGGIDEGIIFTDYYTDADGDGFGDASASPVSACAPVVGSVTNNNDCNDLNAAINPSAIEICGNLIDEDCNGLIDNIDSVYIEVLSVYPVCQPNIITLGANPTDGGLTYQWYRNGLLIPGATNVTYDVFEKRGYYKVAVSNGECTVLSDSIYERIYGPQPPVINSYGYSDLCVQNPIKLKTIYGFAPTHEYQWYRNDVLIEGATNAVYFATEPGSYNVMVFAPYLGCQYVADEPTILTQEGCRMDENTTTRLVVYPNPTSGVLNVDASMESNAASATLEVFNVIGELVYSASASINTGNISESIDLTNIAKIGLYTLKITVDNTIIIKQFVIQN